MTKPGFSITEIEVNEYPNWKVHSKGVYEVLHVDIISDVDSWFLIVDGEKDFVWIRPDHCKLGEIHWIPANWSWCSSHNL